MYAIFRHAFEYDSLYVDKLGEQDLSVYVKWEKSSRFDLKPKIYCVLFCL